MVVVLATSMVMLLYGTAVGHALLDSVPDEAWDRAHSLLGAGPFLGVEDRQDADGLVAFVVCVLICSPFVFMMTLAISRHRARNAAGTPGQMG